MFVGSGETDLYAQMYPRGWCMVPEMEKVHQETWTRVAQTLRQEIERGILGMERRDQYQSY